VTKFGVHVGPQQCAIGELRQVWESSEQLGFDWLSVWDHFYPAPYPLDGDCFEAVACHAALAVATKRPRLGCLVYSAGYRNPAVLANSCATIDHLSGGRLEMGIGGGWHKWEYQAYGIPFEAPVVRLRRLAEAVQIIRMLWTQETTDFDGEFWTMSEARCNPHPLQQPPRIWIGATGEQVGLKVAGRLGDGWNLAFESAESFARKRDIVRSHAPDPDRIVTAANVGLVTSDHGSVEDAIKLRFGSDAEIATPGIMSGSTEALTDQVGRYVEAGADWMILALRAPFELGALESFATNVVPHFL
jgi:alkanesulfonate monooxygenase SsuD/methylene tetrahydromethanopterin reductase-like flavin-dependent oxidoreductase (luciferase family)